MTEDAATIESRLRALSLYLRELHALRASPVRNVASQDPSALRDSRFEPDLPGVRLDHRATDWLVLELPQTPPEPDPPTELIDAFIPRLQPRAGYVLRSDLDDAVIAAADGWLRRTWDPWRQAVRRVDLARQLYLTLFAAHERIDSGTDDIELVWGFGRVIWPKHSLDYPLVTVPVDIVFDGGRSRLSVHQSAPLRVETRMLAGLDLAAGDQFDEAARTIHGTQPDPWDEHFLEQIATPLVRMISNDGAEQQGPTLHDGWCLFTHTKASGYLDFLASLDEHLDTLSALPALASLVVEDPHSLDTLASDNDSDRPVAPPALFPLASNDEQRLILDHVRRSPGVTVEGPPGTGKSHTIANLICALVAEGKRVLVTAERAPALEVLMDKIPEQLRPLCVPVLGVSQLDRQRLETAIDRISQAAFGLGGFDCADGAELESKLASVRQRLAALSNEMRSGREAEVATPPAIAPPEAQSDLAQLARWLNQTEAELALVPDRLDLHTPCPLGESEALELARLLAISPADAVAAMQPLPDTTCLPSAAQLAMDEQSIARAEQAMRARLGSQAGPVPPTVAAQVKQGLGLATEASALLRTFASDFRSGILAAVADPRLRGVWASYADNLDEAVDSALRLRRQLQGHRVSSVSGERLTPDERKTLVKARAALADKGKLGIGNSQTKRIIQRCRVDDAPPTTAEHLDLVLAHDELSRTRSRLADLLSEEQATIGAELPAERPEELSGAIAQRIRDLIDWFEVGEPQLRASIASVGLTTATGLTLEQIEQLERQLEALTLGAAAAGAVSDRNAVMAYLSESPSDASALWVVLIEALVDANWQAWSTALDEAQRLTVLAPRARRREELLSQVEQRAPLLGAALRTGEAKLPLEDASVFHRAWTWRQIAVWFEQAPRSPEEIAAERLMLETQRTDLVRDLIAARAWASVTERIDGPTQRNLAAYKEASARLGKGTSKFAARFQAQIREATLGCRHAIPVWIMPVARALTDFRCEAVPPFDVLIIDEASQIPITSMPILGLARKVIVVGDDKQISPTTPGLEMQPTFDLQRRHLSDIPGAQTTFEVSASLYAAASERLPRKVTLREHFRCLPEIIRFSNERYYGGSLVPLRDRKPTDDWQSTHAVLVADGYREGDCNPPEAEYAAALIATLIGRPEYEGKSFGVITLHGKQQSKLIHDHLFDRLGPLVLTERRIRVGEPPLFQGDERDVIVVSTVVSDAEGRRLAAMTRRDHRQAINVTASRARDQLWILHSVPADAFAKDDERAALIRHCSGGSSADDTYGRLELETDARSPFERDLLRVLVDRGYQEIRPQYKVGRYRIDFVVAGPRARLAIECDGDRYHGPDQWDADRERQAVLERADWTFFRIRGSAFYRDRQAALAPLWQRLEALGIMPGGRETPSLPPIDVSAELTRLRDLRAAREARETRPASQTAIERPTVSLPFGGLATDTPDAAIERTADPIRVIGHAPEPSLAAEPEVSEADVPESVTDRQPRPGPGEWPLDPPIAGSPPRPPAVATPSSPWEAAFGAAEKRLQEIEPPA